MFIAKIEMRANEDISGVTGAGAHYKNGMAVQGNGNNG